MQDALLLSRADLETVLDFESVLRALEEAFRAEHRGEWDTPRRIAAHTKAGGLLAMPCAGGSPEALGAKLVSTFSGNGALGLPSVSGLYALFDPRTGTPLSVMDGGYLTLIRTASVSALATRLLARADVRTLGILGAGAQAEFHIRVLATVRRIETVVIWARRKEQAEAMLARLKARPDLRQVTGWRIAEDESEAAGCDVVVTATTVTEPVLSGRALAEGSHVNAIGAHTRSTREIDTAAVTRASLLAVETRDTLMEAGDFQMAEAEAGGVVARVLTLGALLSPRAAPAPRDPRAISVFKSCGIAFEDLAVAALAFRRAQELNLGVHFSFGVTPSASGPVEATIA
jgi:ornithine cyclodeaminase